MTPRAILLDVIPPDMEKRVAERRLTELKSLTATYGGITIVTLIQKRSVPDYRTFVGSGKLQEIIRIATEERANLLIINNLLKPRQMYELGEQLRTYNVAAWDRIDLILKIFQKHATTAEAKLQIKLAAIKHMGPRIFGMGMEMMQQAGGIGTRGAGETNTEIMKRHLSEQEKQFKKQLERVARSRQEHRRSRDRRGLKTASIVGYTNAGKSSLMRALTKKGVYVADEMFATLDTRVAKLRLSDEQTILLSDTIGFIQDLPPELVSAFRSTLDETVDAELLLHVIDASDEHVDEKISEVNGILDQLGVQETPRLHVFNKIDLVSPNDLKKIHERFAELDPIFVSCTDGTGLEELKRRLSKKNPLSGSFSLVGPPGFEPGTTEV